MDENRGKSEFSEYEFILKMLHILGTHKYRVFALAIFMAALSFGGSFLLTPKFSAQNIIALNLTDGPGGVNPSEYRGSNTLGVVEYEFLVKASQGNERDRVMMRIRSYDFLSYLFTVEDILPVLYPDLWNSEDNTWLNGTIPDIRQAVIDFNKNMFSVFADARTELITVQITETDPERATRLANSIPGHFNEFIKNLEVSELDARRVYLEERLGQIRNTEMHRSIYRLIEGQMSIESLINARQNFPLEVIQPATVPLFKSFPNRKVWTMAVFIVTLALGFLGVLVMNMVSVLRKDLSKYEESISETEVGNIESDSDNMWVER